MMTIKNCKQCGLDYMYSNNDFRYRDICQSCFQKNEVRDNLKKEKNKRKKVKTQNKVYEKQRQCVECSYWFYPKNNYQQVCDDDCRAVRKKRLKKIHKKQAKKSPAEQLRTYRFVTKATLNKLDENTLFKRANQAVIRLELIDDLLIKKFGTSLKLLIKKNEGK